MGCFSFLAREKDTFSSAGVYVANIAQNKGNALFIIDPQNDFMDKPEGALAVKNARSDSIRTASLIMKNLKEFNEIYVSLDSHERYHIAHANFWWRKEKDVNDNKSWEEIARQPVESLQTISRESLDGVALGDGKLELFVPRDPAMTEWAKEYTSKLEKTGNFKLMVWPNHCLIGTNGHAVQPDIAKALEAWENFGETPRTVHYVMKGRNSKTEHYSAFKAEVIVPGDKATEFNHELYDALKVHDKIFVCGQARSHCVKHTVKDLVGALKEDGINPLDKVVLLEGAMSDVEHFEEVGGKFWTDMVDGKVTKSVNITDIHCPANGWCEIGNAKVDEEVEKIGNIYSLKDLISPSPEV